MAAPRLAAFWLPTAADGGRWQVAYSKRFAGCRQASLPLDAAFLRLVSSGSAALPGLAFAAQEVSAGRPRVATAVYAGAGQEATAGAAAEALLELALPLAPF